MVFMSSYLAVYIRYNYGSSMQNTIYDNVFFQLNLRCTVVHKAAAVSI